MSKTYIYDINGNKYSFVKLPLDKTLSLQKEFSKVKEEDFDVAFNKTIEIFNKVFMIGNPGYTGDFYNDIIEYNYSELGIENLVKLLHMVLEEVFQLKGANTNKYPFLQEVQED